MIFQLFEDIWRQSSTLKKKEVLKAYLQSLTEENQKEAIELISEHTIRKDKIKIKKQILISCIGQIVKKFINSNYKEYQEYANQEFSKMDPKKLLSHYDELNIVGKNSNLDKKRLFPTFFVMS